MQPVVIVEPNHSHEEVLFPWIELLRQKYEVYVVAPKTLFDVDLLQATRDYYHAVSFTSALPDSRLKRIAGIPKKYLAIRDVIREINPCVILFNSVPTFLDALLIASIFNGYKKIQIIHNFKRYPQPLFNYCYNYFDANLVISEQVYNHLRACHPAIRGLDYVLPIYFDSFLARTSLEAPLFFPTAECIHLGVFGTVDQSRRNYLGLLDELSHITNLEEMESRFHVHIVGKAPFWLTEEIAKKKLDRFITYYHEFVPFGTMFNILENIDIVLFLIDNQVLNARFYNLTKISGTSTLMKAFSRVGAASDDFIMDDTLKSRCLFYPGSSIGQLLKKICTGEITHTTLQAIIAQAHPVDDFDFEIQRQKLEAVIQRIAFENKSQHC